MLNIKRSLPHQKGFTLIELMISIGLGITAVSAILFFYLTNLTSSYSTLKISKLQQEINTLVSVISSDIRRAGYGGLGNNSDPTANAFSTESTRLAIYNNDDIEIGDADQDDGTASCIVFTYDQDKSGLLTSDEYFGYRRFGNVAQIRNGGLDNDSCKNDNNSWESLTDNSEIIIDEMTFNLDGSKCIGYDADGVIFDCYSTTPSTGDRTIEIREVLIHLSAYLTEDPDVSLTIDKTVRVRNNHVRIIP